MFVRFFSVMVVLSALTACEHPGKTDAAADQVMDLARMNGCVECHGLRTMKIGPPWKDVAERYEDTPAVREMLIEKVKKGGSGAWTEMTGGAVMPANSPRVSDRDIRRLVDFILALDAGDSPN